MLNIVLFGPPGAGKGTQSNFLIKKYNLIHLSTGDILRNEIKTGTKLGIEAKTIMNKGELVPDKVVINMISTKLDSLPDANGFIFDGFPRTTAQAVNLDKMLSNKATSISAMISLKVDDDELIKRLLERGKDSGRADDQDKNIIQNRINEYNKKTAPLKDYYLAQNKLSEIQGTGTISDIANRLNKIINTLSR